MTDRSRSAYGGKLGIVALVCGLIMAGTGLYLAIDASGDGSRATASGIGLALCGVVLASVVVIERRRRPPR